MENTSDRSYQQQKKCLAEQLWLHYFNSALYEQDLITEAQRNRIGNLIDSRNMRNEPFKKKKSR